jgi:hypothetical protein
LQQKDRNPKSETRDDLGLSARQIQTKLIVNQSGDQYEREADRIADAIVRGSLDASVQTPAARQRLYRQGTDIISAPPLDINVPQKALDHELPKREPHAPLVSPRMPPRVPAGPTCFTGSVCQHPIPGSSWDFSHQVSKEETKAKQRLAHDPELRRQRGNARVADAVERFVRDEMPNALVELTHIIVDPAMADTHAGGTLTDCSLLADTPENRMKWCVEIPHYLEEQARAYLAGDKTIDRPRTRWILKHTIAHELGHKHFLTATPGEIAQRSEITRFELGELAAQLTEIPVGIEYLAAADSDPQIRRARFENAIHFIVNRPGEGIRGMLTKLRCINPCDQVDRDVRAVWASSAASWPPWLRNHFLAVITDPALNLRWPVPPPPRLELRPPERSSLEETTPLRRKAAAPFGAEAPPIVYDVLRSSSQSLDATTRRFFESRFGHDFSQVQVHTDAKAAESVDAVDAHAYTVGHHIVFDARRYRPNSAAGQRLLAHELTHVVQQGGKMPTGNQLRVADPDDIHEEIAASTANRMVENRRGTSSVPLLIRPAKARLQRQTAVEENVPPLRADESAKTTTTYNFGEFSIFIPNRVTMGSAQEDRNPKVHIFFAAGGVQGLDTNDIALHGLRGSSDSSLWITIGVPGQVGGANTISDSQIRECLRSVGFGPPSVVRLTGHSRGCDSLTATVHAKLISTPIDRVVLLDEAVEHVDPKAKLPDGSPDPAAGTVRVNRVAMLIKDDVPADKIYSYESTNKSQNIPPAKPKSARVLGAPGAPVPHYIDLNPSAMAAIGAARLVQDAMALDSKIAADANANPKIVTQLRDLSLPPRGTFTTGPTTPTRTNINEFCLEPADPSKPDAPPKLKASITAIVKDRVLLRFIDQHKDMTRYSTVASWAGLAGHEFFVAEIAHELTE